MAVLSESRKIDALAVLIAAITVLYLFAKRSYSYWERKGFKTLSGYNYLFGHFTATITQKEFLGETITKLYNSTNEKFVGIYSIFRPILLVRDPELIRSILIKDFSHFTDRDVHCNENFDPLSAVLFALSGQRWKNLRTKLTPAFSSGKLKSMFSTLYECGSTLQNYLKNYADKDETIEIRDLAARYTTNVIASIGFGIDIDTITDPSNDFRKYGIQIFSASIDNAIRWFLFFVAPKLMTIFRIKIVNAKVDNFFRSITRQNLEYREKNHVNRKDYFQLLIQLRNNGTVQLDDEWETVIKANENQKSLTENEITALTFQFFAAGFETSSTTLSFCLYELAKKPEIQQCVQIEIDKIIAEHDKKITFESISNMKYLECCFDETLRKYPILSILNRMCVKDYKIPGTNQMIEKGTSVFIPVMGLQRDKKYYEEPEKFNPDRFSVQNSTSNPYMPFGEGPRSCIAARLGKMQTKVGLVMMLQKFRFELGDEHKNREIQLDPKSFLISALGGINLRVLKR